MALDDTAAGTSSNAFCDVEFADEYHEERLFSTDWHDVSTPEEKEAAIISATRILNSLDWNGTIDFDSSQSLRFPRENLYDPDGRVLSGIPLFLKQATCELAIALVRSEDVRQSAQLERLRVDVIDMTFFKPAYTMSVLPHQVIQLITPYVSSFGNSVKVVRT